MPASPTPASSPAPTQTPRATRTADFTRPFIERKKLLIDGEDDGSAVSRSARVELGHLPKVPARVLGVLVSVVRGVVAWDEAKVALTESCLIDACECTGNARHLLGKDQRD